MGTVVVILVLLTLVGLAVAILSVISERKRRAALSALSGTLGMRYSFYDPFAVETHFSYMSLFRLGGDRYAFNVISGEYRTGRLLCFDYHYETHSTDSKGHRRTTHHYNSCVLAPVDAAFRPLLIRPENILDKLAAVVGLDDIDFESAEFSRRFYVKGSDKKFAYDIVHPRAMELLLLHAGEGYTFELRSEALLIHRQGKWDPERVRAALDLTVEFVDLIPEYVWQDARARSGR